MKFLLKKIRSSKAERVLPESGFSASPPSEDRNWRRAVLYSCCVHLLFLVIMLWVSAIPDAEANVVVEFRQTRPAAASGGASAASQATQQQSRSAVNSANTASTSANKSQSKAKSTATSKAVQTKKTAQKPTQAETPAKVVTPEPTPAPRELNLVRKQVSTPSSSKARTESTRAANRTGEALRTSEANRELSLSRGRRYVGDPGGGGAPASGGGSPASGRAASSASASSGGGGSGLPGSQGVESTGLASAQAETGSGSGRSGKGQALSGRQASSSLFDWADGQRERQLIAQQQSSLPASVRGRGITAETQIRFKVDPQGHPFGVELIRTSGYHELDEWTMRYVRTFRFSRVNDRFTYEAEYTQLFKP